LTDISPEVLDSKEQELGTREQFVSIQEQYIKDGLDTNGNRIRSKPNWPICCPFLYHSLFKGTKSGFPRAVAIQGYIAWFIIIIILFLNFGCSIAIVSLSVTSTPPAPNTTFSIDTQFRYTFPLNNIMEEKSIKQGNVPQGQWTFPNIGDGVVGWDRVRFVITAFLQFILIIPIHFYLCYWPLYKCMVSLSTARFILFFIGYNLALIFDILSITGIYELGFTGVYCGILYIPLTSTNGNIAGIVINAVMMLLWICLFIYHIIICIQVLFLFRRENYYLRKLGTKIKEGIVGCFTGALKKSVAK